MQTRLSANQSARSILAIYKTFYSIMASISQLGKMAWTSAKSENPIVKMRFYSIVNVII